MPAPSNNTSRATANIQSEYISSSDNQLTLSDNETDMSTKPQIHNEAKVNYLKKQVGTKGRINAGDLRLVLLHLGGKHFLSNLLLLY